MNMEGVARTLNAARREARANVTRRRQWRTEFHELFHGAAMVMPDYSWPRFIACLITGFRCRALAGTE